MSTVIVSPKFQVVIPKAIRESLGITAGMRLRAIEYGGRIELVPIMSSREARGFLKGIDTSVPREPDRS